jgi:anthranilate phosphoribosyltransferase
MRPRISSSIYFSLFASAAYLTGAFTAGFVATSRSHSSRIGRKAIHFSPSAIIIGHSSGGSSSWGGMTTSTKASLKPYIETLILGERSLTSDETKAAFSEILRGADEVQVGSLLTLLRARGETPAEVAGMVQAMNDACNAVDLGDMRLLDIVGTGGDGADTINISTASAVLSAACGCIVAKVGNRSVSSACGSADVLEALGVKVDLQPKEVAECVKQCNVAFMFAPVNHPSTKHVAPVRKKLGVRTCFNILGPMTNPAGAQRAVIGVFHPELMPLMAGALQQVGRIEHAVIIHGVGLDEISPLGPATILEVREGLFTRDV